MAANATLRIPGADESGQIVKLRFQEFLQNFHQYQINNNLNNNVETDDSQRQEEVNV